MTNTDILLEDLEDVLDDATSIPLSKKYAVDVDKIKTIIEDIRLNTPQETKQAKAIVDSRNNILEEAKKEAADIIAKAQEEARELVARDQITQTAQAEAADILLRLRSRVILILPTLKIRLPIFSATLQIRLTKWLPQRKISQEKCLLLLITMPMILFFQLMILFIRHLQMSAESARVSKTLRIRINKTLTKRLKRTK